ncbi:MAG TPA: cytochrome c [Burkholderiales bacterium]|nr:cytochrome c [Burkholderiales bacterium]
MGIRLLAALGFAALLLSHPAERIGALAATSRVPASAAPAAPPELPAKLDVPTWRARQAFAARCSACHSLGAGRVVGPDLAGVTLRRTDDWLARWLSSPEIMLNTDERARALFAEFGIPMPNPGLSDAQVHELIRYFHVFDARPAAGAMP